MVQRRLEKLRKSQPQPEESIEWDANHMPGNYSQEGSQVWFRYPQGYVFWDMPEDFNLATTRTSLLCLTTEILLHPWELSTCAPFSEARVMGERASLSFLEGTDSTAAALVMPGPFELPFDIHFSKD